MHFGCSFLQSADSENREMREQVSETQHESRELRHRVAQLDPRAKVRLRVEALNPLTLAMPVSHVL